MLHLAGMCKTSMSLQNCGKNLGKTPLVMFQHDNAPMHEARSIKKFPQFGVEELPDLSPIFAARFQNMESHQPPLGVHILLTM